MEPRTWEILDAVERTAGRVYTGLRTGGPAWDDVAGLACLLFDAGNGEQAVVDVLERRRGELDEARLLLLARRVLDAAGFDPGFRLAPERLGRLCHALDLAARDLPAAWAEPAPRLTVRTDGATEWAAVELADGWMHGAPLNPGEGDTPGGALTAVADHLQETVLERYWQAWPVCAVHERGLHPVADGDSAVWRCGGASAAAHTAAPVGELL